MVWLVLSLSLISHICASLFMAKPRFNKVATAAIWLAYSVVFLILPPEMPPINFYITLVLHGVLFLATTVGRLVERGFLFLSYVCIYSIFTAMVNIVDVMIDVTALKITGALVITAIWQFLLYAIMVPSFKKVVPHLKNGWTNIYLVVVAYFVLIIVVETSISLPIAQIDNSDINTFICTSVAFFLTYVSIFDNMKKNLELAKEKRKLVYAELLQSQVESQEKEVKSARKNRHDLRHHYELLLSYAQKGELAKITAYLEEQTEQLDAEKTYRFCVNETVNNILSVYSRKAAAKNIQMDAAAVVKSELRVTAPDLVAIIANILENALNGACDSKTEKPIITVDIHHKDERLVIKCENSCAEHLCFEEISEELCGVGIGSIVSTAERYNGTCRFTAESGTFACTVIMDA